MKSGTWLLMILVLCVSNGFAQMTVKDSDSNTLIQVNDEGSKGSISLPAMSSEPTSATDKLTIKTARFNGMAARLLPGQPATAILWTPPTDHPVMLFTWIMTAMWE